MHLKERIRTQICVSGQPSITTLNEFIRWAETIDQQRLQALLDEIQNDFNDEEAHFRVISELMNRSLLHHQLRQQWCKYCAELRVYYRSVSQACDNSIFNCSMMMSQGNDMALK